MKTRERNHREDPLTMPTVSSAWDKSATFHRVPSYYQETRYWKGTKHHYYNHNLAPSEQAFGDDLQLGRVVHGRLKNVVEDYDKDGVRPLLVTGLWRRGSVIEKIEVMRYTTNVAHTDHPDKLRIDTQDLMEAMASDLGGMFKACDSIVMSNTEQNFPSAANTQMRSIFPSMWPEILVRNAGSLIYNPRREVSGYNAETMEGLVREGFFFPTIPATAVSSKHFAPELMSDGKTTDILPQTLVDMIADYALRYSEEHRATFGHRHFSFPPMNRWRFDNLPEVPFPNWSSIRQRTYSSSPVLEAQLP